MDIKSIKVSGIAQKKELTYSLEKFGNVWTLNKVINIGNEEKLKSLIQNILFPKNNYMLDFFEQNKNLVENNMVLNSLFFIFDKLTRDINCITELESGKYYEDVINQEKEDVSSIIIFNKILQRKIQENKNDMKILMDLEWIYTCMFVDVKDNCYEFVFKPFNIPSRHPKEYKGLQKNLIDDILKLTNNKKNQKTSNEFKI